MKKLPTPKPKASLSSDSAKKYSIDASVWGRAIECGLLEDASQTPPDDAYEWTTSPEKAPDKPEIVHHNLLRQVSQLAVNSKKMAPLALIEEVNKNCGQKWCWPH